MHIISVYAPDSGRAAKHPAELLEFYCDLRRLVAEGRAIDGMREAPVIILGDFNAEVGRVADEENEWDGALGPCLLNDKVTPNGTALLNFCCEDEDKFVIANSFFQKKVTHTFEVKKCGSKITLDHILVDAALWESEAVVDAGVAACQYFTHADQTDHFASLITLELPEYSSAAPSNRDEEVKTKPRVLRRLPNHRALRTANVERGLSKLTEAPLRAFVDKLTAGSTAGPPRADGDVTRSS
jgi:hypothetical protein